LCLAADPFENRFGQAVFQQPVLGAENAPVQRFSLSKGPVAMTPRLLFIPLLALSLPGCVAAIPMAAQLASNPNSMTQLCSMTKMTGQTSSLCERMGFVPAAQAPRQELAQNGPANHVKPAKVPTNGVLTTAER
jgi:hypothetical protein